MEGAESTPATVEHGDERAALATLRCEGELDVEAVRRIEAFVTTAVERRLARIVLDLRRVTRVDSTGVCALIDAERRCEDAGVVLQVEAGEEVCRTLELLGVRLLSVLDGNARDRVTVEVERDVVVVALLGEHDAERAPELERIVSRVAHWPRLVLDLSGVTFLDSAVLGALVRRVRGAVELGARVAVVQPATRSGATLVGTLMPQGVARCRGRREAFQAVAGGAPAGSG